MISEHLHISLNTIFLHFFFQFLKVIFSSCFDFFYAFFVSKPKPSLSIVFKHPTLVEKHYFFGLKYPLYIVFCPKFHEKKVLFFKNTSSFWIKILLFFVSQHWFLYSFVLVFFTFFSPKNDNFRITKLYKNQLFNI